MKRIVQKPQRKFLGKTSDFKDRDEKVFNQRMLKAYLNGRKTFHFGFDTEGFPKSYDVLQEPVPVDIHKTSTRIPARSTRCGKNMSKP